jgi:predicted nucleic acid-binding protein
MIYLLDVNALVALGFMQHEFHDRVASWVSGAAPGLASCSITELGFVRVLSQTQHYALTVADASKLLLRLKNSSVVNFRFIADNQDISQIPVWVKTPSQLTDGHLLQLAKSNNAALATLDRKIPGAFVIP